MSNTKAKKGPVFKVGGHLPPTTKGADERRFEAGDPLPKGLTPKDLKALRENDCIDDGIEDEKEDQ